jgi:hypothetical protein
MVGKIQERYGLKQEEALRQVEEWNSTLGHEGAAETASEHNRKLPQASCRNLTLEDAPSKLH